MRFSIYEHRKFFTENSIWLWVQNCLYMPRDKIMKFSTLQSSIYDAMDLDSFYFSNKRDGDRVFLVVYNNFIYMLNCSGIFFYVNSTTLRNNYILEGEWHKNRKKIFLFDILIYEDLNLKKEKFSYRLLCLQDFYLKAIDKKLGDDFTIKLNKFVKRDCGALFKWREKKDFEGLILTSQNAIYENFSHFIFRWKENNTLDVLVEKVKDKYCFCLIRYRLREAKYYKIVFEEANYDISLYNGRVVEIEWSSDMQEWRIKRVRYDKNCPNSYEVAQDILSAIRTPLSWHDIVRRF